MDKKLQQYTRESFRIWTWVVIFAIAFAWVEGSVVVYLREIYFDGSFSFPIVFDWEDGKRVIEKLVRIELVREVATILILVSVAAISGKNAVQKFSYFMIAFGIWDIFFYIWLRVMSGWPESLMTWDLLFFIPRPWVGPVITPVLISVAMTVAGTMIVFYDTKGWIIRWRWFDLVIELWCAFLMVVAFCWDWKNIMRVPDGQHRSGFPNPFAWWLYAPAFLFSVVYFAVRFRKAVSRERKEPTIG